MKKYFLSFLLLTGCLEGSAIKPAPEVKYDCSQISQATQEQMMASYDACLRSGEDSSEEFYLIVKSCEKSVQSFFCKPVSHE